MAISQQRLNNWTAATGVHVTAQWTSPDDDAAAMQLIHHIGSDIAASASSNGASLAYRFMNDAYDGQNVLSSYGEGNMQRLKEIADKYDPDGVFQRLQNGGWLLRREE